MGLITRWRLALAGLWGFAEATLFFIVPDVLLSLLAARLPLARLVLPVLIAAVAASLGGALMWGWASAHPAAVFERLDAIPAISRDMLSAVTVTMAGPDWILGMAQGAISGVPYKTFAAAAGVVERDLVTFVAWSVPVRAARFLAVVLLTAYFRLHFRLWGIERAFVPVLIVAWTGFYAVFWTTMPN